MMMLIRYEVSVDNNAEIDDAVTMDDDEDDNIMMMIMMNMMLTMI
jgi:hypothetical protein